MTITTNGLTSAYQLTGATGAEAASADTGGILKIAGKTICNPRMIFDRVEPNRANSHIQFVPNADPAHLDFSGSIGMPASHTQLAQRFETGYRTVTDNYEDIPDDIL